MKECRSINFEREVNELFVFVVNRSNVHSKLVLTTTTAAAAHSDHFSSRIKLKNHFVSKMIESKSRCEGYEYHEETEKQKKKKNEQTIFFSFFSVVCYFILFSIIYSSVFILLSLSLLHSLETVDNLCLLRNKGKCILFKL